MDGNNNQYNQQYGQPEKQETFNQNNVNMGNGYRNTVVNSGPTPGFTLWLTLSILQLMCCNQATGIICLIMTLLADSDFKKGDYPGYNSKLKVVKITALIGVILFILTVSFAIFYVAFLNVAVNSYI